MNRDITLIDFRAFCSRKLGCDCSGLFRYKAWLEINDMLGPDDMLLSDWVDMIEGLDDDAHPVYALKTNGDSGAIIKHTLDCSENDRLLAVSESVDELIDYAGFCPDTNRCADLWCPFRGYLNNEFEAAKKKYENFSHGDQRWAKR